MILISTIIPTLLWADLRNEYIWLVTAILVTFGIIGYLDDIRKLRGVNNKGVPGRTKLLLEIGCALVVSVLIYQRALSRPSSPYPFSSMPLPTWGSSISRSASS